MQTDESELIARSLNQDHQAYAELVDRYKNALYRHCFAIVRREDVAQDIAQDTFVTAYYKLNKYDPKFRLSTWLFKIATNKALDHLRRAAKEVAMDDEFVATIVSTLPNTDQASKDSEVRQAVQNLSPKHRAVISLYYWHGLNYQEIAYSLGSPLGSVKVWMLRAKQELRKELS